MSAYTYLDKVGLTNVWNKIKSEFVAKDGDKMLSDNNFTDDLKSKLEGLNVGSSEEMPPTAFYTGMFTIRSTSSRQVETLTTSGINASISGNAAVYTASQPGIYKIELTRFESDSTDAYHAIILQNFDGSQTYTSAYGISDRMVGLPMYSFVKTANSTVFSFRHSYPNYNTNVSAAISIVKVSSNFDFIKSYGVFNFSGTSSSITNGFSYGTKNLSLSGGGNDFSIVTTSPGFYKINMVYPFAHDYDVLASNGAFYTVPFSVTTQYSNAAKANVTVFRFRGTSYNGTSGEENEPVIIVEGY